jgi:hypothetical protein
MIGGSVDRVVVVILIIWFVYFSPKWTPQFMKGQNGDTILHAASKKGSQSIQRIYIN